MSMEPADQAIQQFKIATNVLIVVSETNNPDSLAAALALRRFLIKQEKQVTVISTAPIPPKFRFLADSTEVKPDSGLSKNLVIDISLKNNEIGEMRYQKSDDKLSIFVTTKSGEFGSGDVSVRGAVYPFNLVVTIGVGNLEVLGNFYSRHAQLFFETPIINLDFKASNENYGQINVVELTASSTSEVVFDLLTAYDQAFVDENTATLLLAGLIGQTNSFQTVKTSPQVFLKASTLINLGAKQQDIITALYRSKTLGLLRLWGRVLARVKDDPRTQLVYSVVTLQDIEKSEAGSDDLEQIIIEMIQQLPFAKTFVFMAEKTITETLVYAATTTPLNLQTLFAQFNPQTLGQPIKFIVPKPLLEVSESVIAAIHAELSKYTV